MSIPLGFVFVFVVDDDASVRESVADLAQRAGLRAEVFASAREFLARPQPTAPCCLVLDLFPPDLTGLELQAMRKMQAGSFPELVDVARKLGLTFVSWANAYHMRAATARVLPRSESA
jgi:FixJ family two-component response regulator